VIKPVNTAPREADSMTTTRTTEALMDKIEYVVAEARQSQIPLESIIDAIREDFVIAAAERMVQRWKEAQRLADDDLRRRVRGERLRDLERRTGEFRWQYYLALQELNARRTAQLERQYHLALRELNDARRAEGVSAAPEYLL
jgi:hypothetical protein